MLGYRVTYGENIHKRFGGYLAGSDAERLADLHAMFANPAIDAIFCARGGFGSARLLPFIDWDLIRRNPKIFVGFSDLTAFQLALWKRLKLVSFCGAMPSVDFADPVDPETEEVFWRVLTSSKPLGAVQQSLPLSRSRVTTSQTSSHHTVSQRPQSGRLMPVNLSVFCSMLGTPWMPSLKHALMVFEDIGEETYRIDRLLTQVRLAGVFDNAAGAGFGYFSQHGLPKTATPHRDVSDVLEEVRRTTSCPFVTGLMFGHEHKKLTLPMGVKASFAPRGKAGLILHEAAVQ